MKQVFIITVNIPHDQYGLEADELQETLTKSHDPHTKFKVIPVERENVTVASYLR